MKSIFSVFKNGLQKTATTISRTISTAFTDTEQWTEENYEELESMLISADFGINATMKIVDNLRDKYNRGIIKTKSDIIEVTKNDVCEILEKNIRPINIKDDDLTVILMVGVNGSGKTTTTGKLARLWKNDGKKVILAACDTFRAAAVEQLKLWGTRTDCSVISSFQGADPSAVAFDAVQSALAKSADILILDTAGRQHTKKGLMDELAKMCRAISKAYPNAPQEVWLTIDASMGANALIQAKEFAKIANVTGLILTKLDGTGKGGMAVAIQNEFHLPVFFVGLGESPEDLQPFHAGNYVNAIFD